jgi:hypothetical protein
MLWKSLADGRGLIATDANPEELASLIDMILSNSQLKGTAGKKG